MADCWSLLERARSTILPMLVFLLALYLPKIQRICAQNLPKINLVMTMKEIPTHCVEGQTIILYCNVNGLSSVSQYEVNWTKGIKVSHDTGVALVRLDPHRTHKASWGDPESDSVTYSLKVENVTTTTDTAIYTCQIFYRTATGNHGSSAWDSMAESKEVTVHEATGPLPQCTSSRTNNKFYSDEQITINCLSHVDGVALDWVKESANSPPMILAIQEAQIISMNFPAEESLHGVVLVCHQYESGSGSCIVGPIHILPGPAPTRLPTTTFPTTPSTIPTTQSKITTEPTLPKLVGYPDGMWKEEMNQTEPTEELKDSQLCPEFVLVLVPTIIAIISVVLNVYLILRLRSERHSKVDKMCENKLCVTRNHSGTIDKDEYCSCGYMLKIAHRESAV